MSEEHILTISALTAAIRRSLEGAFPFVWVRGQVTNLARPASGHVYFSLRDEENTLAAVWFKNSQKAGESFDPLTGEVYEDGPRPSLAGSLENGQEIVCAGKIAVYGVRGVYQLVVEIAQKAGLGRLHEEFERLRAKLAELGYFDAERKRPLPRHPERVAVITAPQGAAIHDFTRIAENRGLSSRIRIYPALVQGAAAPGQLIAALKRIWSEGWAELVVLIRGGGSIEDLWAFNDEGLARAIYESPLPVLAGIGHEVDFTLSDMTADVRAATPSHAAQLLWPAREELAQRVDYLAMALDQAKDSAFERAAAELHSLARDLAWRSPARSLQGWENSLRSAFRLLQSAGRLHLEREDARLRACSASLSLASRRLPMHAAGLDDLAARLDGTALRSIGDRESLLRNLSLGLMRAPERLPAQEALFSRLERLFAHAGEKGVTRLGHELENAAIRLEAANPHAPLRRGYALVRKKDGDFVKKTRDASPGEALNILLHDGEIAVHVDGEKQ